MPIDKPLESIITLPGYGITRIADLRGKRLACDPGDTVNIAEVESILATARLTAKDVTFLNVGAALSTSLLTHRVDASRADRNFERFELADRGVKPILFDYEAYGVPANDEMIFLVNRDTRADPRNPRFLAAIREATAYIKAHPEAAWAMFVHAYPGANNPLNHNAWRFTTPYFADDPASLDQAKYTRFGAFLAGKGVIPKAMPVSALAAQLR